MKKSPHIIWVCPSSDSFFRVKGEVHCRPSSVIPKLSEKGLKITVLIPFDPTLLPKSKLTPTRIHRHDIHLAQNHSVEFLKLTRAQVYPQIFMVKHAPLEPALRSALFSKAAVVLAKELNRPVDIFHLFGWQTSLVPLFLEMENGKNGSNIFEKTKTFLNVQNIKELGNFSPNILDYVGIPKELFHPEGVEFYGQVSFLKAGLLFADGVGIVDRSVNGLSGVLNSMIPKLRQWVSARSFKSHMEAYDDLAANPKPNPLLPVLMKRIRGASQQKDTFISMWGPVPPERYHVDSIGFLIQSPEKGFGFWEWTRTDHSELGLLLDDHASHTRTVISRGLTPLGEFWLDLQSNHQYTLELVGWTQDGRMETLLKSRRLRTPRNRPSENKNAIFVDVRSKQRFGMSGYGSWNALLSCYGSSTGTSPGKNFNSNMPSSWREKAVL